MNRLPRSESGSDQVAFNRMFGQYKRQSIRNKQNFNLSKDEFRILSKKPCYFCGKEPYNIIKSNNLASTYIGNGITRINTSEDYNAINCVPCCPNCARLKFNANSEDFLNWINTTYKNLLSKGEINE